MFPHGIHTVAVVIKWLIKCVAGGENGGQSASQEESGGVEACWVRRIQEGDPLEARCQRAKIEEQLDKWIESQIIMHNPDK